MTDDTDTAPLGPEEKSDESGRIRAEYLDSFCTRRVYAGPMSQHPVWILVVVAVLVGVVVTPLAAAGGVPASGPAATDGDAGSATDPGPGPHLAGVVAVQNSTVDGIVASETFQARYANATTDRERATLVDRRLGAIEGRLADTGTRLQELSSAREEGSLSEGAYTARAAALAETADRLADAANATERAAESLPADRRASLRVADRVAAIRTEARRIRGETDGAADAIDGVGEESGVAPVSRATVEAFFDSVAGAETPLSDVASSERMNVHVRRANGTTPVYAVRIENGRVSSVAAEPYENPTLSVYTDYRVVDRVQRAEDPDAAVRAAVENDRIRYDGQGLGNSLKYGTLKLVSLVVG